MKITANKYVAVTYDLNVGEGEERDCGDNHEGGCGCGGCH